MSGQPRGADRLLIGGSLVEAATGATFDNVNPATEQVMGTAAEGSVADMDHAIDAARRAFDDTDWSTDIALRVRCLRQLHEALMAEAEGLRGVVVSEAGSPIALTHGAQLDAPIDGVGWVADFAERYEWQEDLGVAKPFGIASHRHTWREAVGVVGAITPWNFPMQINLAKVAPALAAGNTVILETGARHTLDVTLLGRIVAEQTDIPPGVFNVITSSSHEVGQQLAEDGRVDLISFTGSTSTGRRVMTASVGNLKKVFLELGGKSAAVALDDADIVNAAASTAVQVMTHAGQGCAITTRLVLPRSRWDEGVAALVDTMSAMPYGNPTDPKHLMGPLISDRQRARVLDYIQKGVAEGATVALGGGTPAHLPTGYYVEPTVLVDVQPDATVAQEEIFGPVVVVLAHDGDDDAVAIVNNSVYGLSGAVFSGSADHARAIAARMRTGTVSLNGGLWYGTDVPFGGYKQSGIGREMGRAGFEEYLETKSIAEPADQ